MMRHYRGWVVGLVVAIAALPLAARIGVLRAEARPAPAAIQVPEPKIAPALLLQREIDMKDYQNEMSLKQFLFQIYENLNADGAELPIIVDSNAFKNEDPTAPDIYETRIKFQPFPRKMTIEKALALALGKVASGNATFVTYPDHVAIMPAEHASAAFKLKQSLRVTFNKQPLANVLKQLSDMTATTIVLHPRVTEQAGTLITATFHNDVALGGALRVIAEMADLKVVLLDGVIMVTTPAHADVLQKEQKALQKQGFSLWPELSPMATPVGTAKPNDGGK